MNFDQNFPADGVVDFEHAVRGSEDNFDVRQARFEHVVGEKFSLSDLYFNNRGGRERERETERIVQKRATTRTRENSPRGTSFSLFKRARSLSLSRSFSSSNPPGSSFFSILAGKRERDRERKESL